VGTRSGSVGVHALAGAFVGRFDMAGSPTTDLGGLRVGIGFGEVLQLTGFYWRSIDTDEREFLADRAFGGEARFALNTGFGVAPFITAGVARLSMEADEARTAAVAGAGLQLPLGPVLLSAAAHDYILGVSGLDDRATEDVTHNWLYSIGVTFGLGRSRSREPIVVQRPPVPERTVVAVPPAEPPVAATPDAAARGAVRNFQSDRTIEVPIPLEGSITLRYGPAAAAPAATETTVAAAPAVAGVDASELAADPLLQTWLRQMIGAEVAAQLAARGTPPPVAGGTTVVPFGVDPGGQRSLEQALTALLLRMEANDVQRMNLLRSELRQAVTSQYDAMRAELARIERRLAGEPAVAAAPAPAPRPLEETPPAAAAPRPPAIDPVTVPAARPPAPEVRAVDRALADAALRLALAETARRHPGVLSTGETVRGPAVVMADVAFATGDALLGAPARTALTDVAAVLREHEDRRVYVHGHTDSVGAETSNQLLSELRAETVRSLLVQAGIEATRIHAVGFGEGRPIASNDTATGRAMNRRVEIVIGEPHASAGIRVVLQETDR
jgi:outer membrane protein OmpA-like peptidoglycan-associated protein